ncbi:TolB family protein [Streptomyces kaniharaensis]|uniref:TolB family protein n=1 Tax=Streptomyces kaniharaensis TaxID=212423 RepID=UPI001E5A78F2|nr:hypothetical protein [Streptomyces kaniharaensis]
MAAALTVTAAPPAHADPAWGPTAQVDLGVNGARPDHPSFSLGISTDGRYALFRSEATNLLPGTGKTGFGLYVRDLRNGRTELVSLADHGTPLAAVGETAGISGDGRYVVFSSGATNVVSGQATKGGSNVYVRDRATGRTQLVTAGTASGGDQNNRGAYAPTISADGRHVAYMSTRTDLVPGAATKPGARNVYVTDRVTGATRLVTAGADGQPANGDSDHPTISADGTTVGFSSKASNLLPQKPQAAEAPAELLRLRYTSLYTYDLDSGRTTLASLDASGGTGAAAPAIRLSPDGRYAVYALGASPLPGGKARTELFIHDLWTEEARSIRTSANPAAICWADPSAAITADDRWIYFVGGCSDTEIPAWKARYDLYRQDLTTGRTEPISTAPDGSNQNGAAGDPFVADDGTTVVFRSTSTNILPGSTGAGAGPDWQVYARTLTDD